MRIFICAQFLVLAAMVNPHTTQPPCCRDHLGSTACQRLRKSNSRLFSQRCNLDAEFRLVQCCSACEKSGNAMAYDLVARSLVSEHCFDRYGPQFCGRLVNSTDVFENHSSWSCDGKNPELAFRSCRLSCGYCNFNVVKYTLANAKKACGTPVNTWKDKFAPKFNKFDRGPWFHTG